MAFLINISSRKTYRKLPGVVQVEQCKTSCLRGYKNDSTNPDAKTSLIKHKHKSEIYVAVQAVSQSTVHVIRQRGHAWASIRMFNRNTRYLSIIFVSFHIQIEIK